MQGLNAWSRDARLWISVVIALSALSLSAVAYAGSGMWTSGGPYGRYVGVLAIDPTAPATLYVGTNGGVFKSTDSGGTWAAVNTGLPTLDVRALALDPTGATTLYAGLADGSVWQSTPPTPVVLLRFTAD